MSMEEIGEISRLKDWSISALYIEATEEECFIRSHFKKYGEKYIISTMGQEQIMRLRER